ncbi:MAG: Transcriptional regulator PerR [Acidimicrobiales bacterium]|nr:MAG: transcriptional repressor [Actinomycetota bacterium]MBV6508804.1 Transcriptional regulator PerR [Acidimicrobiales bacterium]RIK03668.1 MAG: transcriptional repressor [Acidobacteriota bacterium]
MKSPAELTELFRSRGLKVTPQRQCIFRVLYGNEAHPTAEVVYETAVAEMPTLSLKTVYQTLNDLADMGELHQLELGTGSARFDANLDAHHHLVCDRCGQVSDVYGDFPEIRTGAAREQGFRITRTEVVFRGLCENCQQAHASGAPDPEADLRYASDKMP